MSHDLTSSFLALASECNAQPSGQLAAFVAGGKQLLADHEAGLVASTASDPLPFGGPAKVEWQIPAGAAGANCSVLPAGWIFAAHQGFASVVSGAFLAKGKWMYEVTLLTDGTMQLGWSCWTALHAWSSKHGVGDFPCTFSYDGQRRKLWNVTAAAAAGPVWLQGDVVACLLDLDAGLVKWSRNGMPVGELRIPTYTTHAEALAAADVCLAFAPGLSLGAYERCLVNLGAAPFSFPAPGFRPVDTARACTPRRWAPRAHLLQAAATTERLGIYSLPVTALLASTCANNSEAIAHFALYTLLGLVGGQDGGGGVTAASVRRATASVLHALHCVMAPQVFDVFVECMAYEAAQRSSHRRITRQTASANLHLQVLAEMVSKQHVRAVLCRAVGFVNVFLNAFRVKAHGPLDLVNVFPPVSNADYDDDYSALTQRSRDLHEAVFAADDEVRCEMLAILLDSPEGAPAVHDVLDVCIRDLRDRPRTTAVPAKRHSDLVVDNVLLCRVFFAIVHYLSASYNGAVAAAGSDVPALRQRLAALHCPPHCLTGPLVPRLEFPRIGGQLAHVQRLAPVTVDPATGPPSLLAKAAILYSLSVKEHVIAASNELAVRQRQKDIIDRIGQPRSADALAECAATTRSALWALSSYRMDHAKLAAFCSLVVHVLDHYFAEPLFLYFPITFVEVFVDVWHFARKTSPFYTQLVARHPEIVMFFVDKLLHRNISHPDTSEYILLSLGGVLGTDELQRMAVVAVLRQHPDRFEQALTLLFKQFGHQLAWTLVVGILAKLNASDAFCMQDGEDEGEQWAMLLPVFGSCEAPPAGFHSHEFFRAAFRRYVTHGPAGLRQTIATKGASDDGTPATFLKNLLTHCNWTLSELGACLAQIDEKATLTNDVLMHRRRCSSVFGLARRLLHLLEFAIAAAGDLFFDVSQSTEQVAISSLRMGGGASAPTAAGLVSASDHARMNCAAVVEIWTQTISRFASTTNHLWRVAALQLPGVDRIKPWKLMASAVGVLYSMLQGGQALDAVANPFLAELSKSSATWTMVHVEFLLRGFDWAETAAKCACNDKSSFAADPKVMAVLTAAHNAVHRHTKLDDDDNGIVEDGTCAICATNVIDTSFAPCGHSSCGMCIRRQLVTQARCFFCNKPIEALVNIDGPPAAAASADSMLQP